MDEHKLTYEQFKADILQWKTLTGRNIAVSHA